MPLGPGRSREFERAQRTAVSILSHPNFRRAVEALEDDPDAVQADPQGFLQNLRLPVPDEATVEAIEGSPFLCFRVCVWSWCWTWCPFG